MDTEAKVNSFSRFFAGFSSGYRKQRAIRATTEPQVKKRTAVLAICALVFLLAAITYWLMTLQSEGNPSAFAFAEDLANWMLGAGKALFALAILGGGFWAYRRRRNRTKLRVR